VNHKQVYRLYGEEQLAVRTRRRKKRASLLRVLPTRPTRPNEQWGMDFMGRLYILLRGGLSSANRDSRETFLGKLELGPSPDRAMNSRTSGPAQQSPRPISVVGHRLIANPAGLRPLGLYVSSTLACCGVQVRHWRLRLRPHGRGCHVRTADIPRRTRCS
jgi:hypothetical protein